MKKSILSIAMAAVLFASSGAVAAAQVKQFSKDISSFEELVVEDEFEVSVIQGNAYNVTFTVDEELMDYVVCAVTGKSLIISLDEKKIPKEIKAKYKGRNAIVGTFKAKISVPEHPTLITMKDKSILYDISDTESFKDIKLIAADKSVIKSFDVLAPSVTIEADKRSTVSVNAACNMLYLDLKGNSNSTVNSKNINLLTIKTDNSASLVCNGDYQNVKVGAKSGSKIIVNGIATRAEFDCVGSSLNFSNLSLEQADVRISGNCELSLNVSARLNLESVNGSSVTYNGNPVIQLGSIVKGSVSKAK